VAELVGHAATLIDLGAGNCEKAGRLFRVLQPAQYVAIDISAEFLENAVAGLRCRFPEIEMLPLALDFTEGIVLPKIVRPQRRQFFYPGSSIGNFDPHAALAFLSDIRRQSAPDGGLLIGVDLMKPTPLLQAAYNDTLGVTAAFNLNLLNRVNTMAEGNFNISQWRHRALFNETLSRIEMYLEASVDTIVKWRGGRRRFRRGERIHTENSYKYALDDFRALLKQAGYASIHTWTDPRQWFAVCHAAI
jgi:dimethylhistidine N-methyltransferase